MRSRCGGLALPRGLLTHGCWSVCSCVCECVCAARVRVSVCRLDETVTGHKCEVDVLTSEVERLQVALAGAEKTSHVSPAATRGVSVHTLREDGECACCGWVRVRSALTAAAAACARRGTRKGAGDDGGARGGGRGGGERGSCCQSVRL